MAKKLTKKVKKHISDNMLVAVALTSLLINMFFLIGVIIYASTDRLDKALYNNAYTRYCLDDDVIVFEEGSLEKSEYEVGCRTGDFGPYYNSALQDYLRDLGY